MRNHWQSQKFRCITNRYSRAELMCETCGEVFDADVEYPETQECWLVAQHEGYAWRSMHLRCPRCGAHEPVPEGEGIHLRVGGIEPLYEPAEKPERIERAELHALVRAQHRDLRREARVRM